jgi:serine phosphatase RsbU (regulator of sigma subunit)
MRVENELSGAQLVQAGLYPKAAPSIPNFDIAGKALPAEKCSGDYFDFIPMKDGQLGIVVGDVSGHGLGPALRMAETRAILHTLARSWNVPHDLEVIHDDLKTILRRANAVLDSVDVGQFVTLFFAKFDPASCSFTYAGAGHRAFLIRADGNVEELRSGGLALGLLRDFDIAESPRIAMMPGDALFVPTDGIEETHTSERELFGKQRMLEHIASRNGNSSAGVLDSVFTAAREFASGYPQQDDMTAVLVRRLATASEGPQRN